MTILILKLFYNNRNYFFLCVGHCPVYNTVEKKMDSRVCFGNLCPGEVFLSNDVYKCIYTIPTTHNLTPKQTPKSCPRVCFWFALKNVVSALGLFRVRSRFAMGLIGFNSWGLLNAQRCLADRPFILPFIRPLPHFIFLIPNVETFGHFSVAICKSASDIAVCFLCPLWVCLGSAWGLLEVGSRSAIA